MIVYHSAGLALILGGVFFFMLWAVLYGAWRIIKFAWEIFVEIWKCIFVAALALSLISCGPFIDTRHGIVHAGFMSSTQAFSGKIKCTDGSSAVWSVTGTDQTSVPNNLITTGGVGYGLAQTTKSHISDNNTSLAKQQDTNATAIKQQQLSNEAAAQAADTTRKAAADPLLLQAGHFKQ